MTQKWLCECIDGVYWNDTAGRATFPSPAKPKCQRCGMFPWVVFDEDKILAEGSDEEEHY